MKGRPAREHEIARRFWRFYLSVAGFWGFLCACVVFGYIASLGSSRGGAMGVISGAAMVAFIALAFWQMWRPYMGSRMSLLAAMEHDSPYDLKVPFDIADTVESAMGGAKLPSSFRSGIWNDARWLQRKGYILQIDESRFSITQAGREALAAYRSRNPKHEV